MEELDSIKITGQKIRCHIGVPEEERASEQELIVHTEVFPYSPLKNLDDDVKNTIDYHTVSLRIENLAAERPRKLIETLAEDIAITIQDEFPVRVIIIEIEKFILDNAQSVGVRITRGA